MMTAAIHDLSTFERLESNVRSYCRHVPMVFTHARGAVLATEDGREVLDFFSGAGALNYGHNDPAMTSAIVEYIRDGRVLHALDFHTSAKRDLLEQLEAVVLAPRGLDYKVQFCGPTGADATEAAIKLARKVTGRRKILAFNGSYHGMTAGALAVSGAKRLRRYGSAAANTDAIFVPYEDSMYGPFDSLAALERLTADAGSGFELPAAVIVESTQIQAGVFTASPEWLRGVRDWATQHDVLLIVDEVQTGCGRTGPFFGFETSGIVPDIVTTAKSISGSGLPLALVLFKRDLDVWEPGEHTGTFRGNQLAYLTARVALGYWGESAFGARLEHNQRVLALFADQIRGLNLPVSVRSTGMLAGLDFGLGETELAEVVQAGALAAGVLVERCGPNGEIVKLMPPINCPTQLLEQGLDALVGAVRTSC